MARILKELYKAIRMMAFRHPYLMCTIAVFHLYWPGVTVAIPLKLLGFGAGGVEMSESPPLFLMR